MLSCQACTHPCEPSLTHLVCCMEEPSGILDHHIERILRGPTPPHSSLLCSVYIVERRKSCSLSTSINYNFTGIMLEGKAVIGETDMLETMQQDALHIAAKALDFFDVTEATEIARFIKKEFDRQYGSGWQCIVGTHFGSFVSHYFGCFIYFCIGNLTILLFRGSTGQEP